MTDKYQKLGGFGCASIFLAFANWLCSDISTFGELIPHGHDRLDHVCRLLGATGCKDTGMQRCQALGIGGNCSGDCFRCDDTANANEAVCVYVEGKKCHEKIGGRTVKCAGDWGVRYHGECIDPQVEGVPCQCVGWIIRENDAPCDQDMLKCHVDPYQGNPEYLP
jgi:hypothetical protein